MCGVGNFRTDGIVDADPVGESDATAAAVTHLDLDDIAGRTGERVGHPNIAAIYGLEESDGTRFLVLELVEGDTLADQLKRGAIPVEESLKLALQIAEALEAAHEKGVIYRDLKPANIKVTPEGSEGVGFWTR